MQVCPKDFYDENYFYPNKKIWIDQFGVAREYHGPAKDWHGFSSVAMYIKNAFPDVKKIFDIGCSAGSFVSRSRELGFDTRGCDISKYAVANCVDGAKGYVYNADICKDLVKHADNDMVVAFDLLEHIYESQLDSAMRYISSHARPGGRLFFCIATARAGNEKWKHSSENDPVPNNKTWLAVAGHVLIDYIEWWIEKIESFGIATDYESMFKFQLWRERNSEMSQVLSWSMRNIYMGIKK